MNRFLGLHCDGIVLALVVAVFVTSLGWCWQSHAEVRRIRAWPVAVHLATSAYSPPVLAATGKPVNPWNKPVAQSSGGGWCYELFTPPAVFFIQSTGSFAVTPPFDSILANPAPGLELLSVKRELYRLQLAGYFGGPGSYTAIFTTPKSSGTRRARVGGRFADLDLALKQFSVRRVAREPENKNPIYEMAAFAELEDERTGATVTLDSCGQKFSDSPVAVVKFPVIDAAEREVRAGEEFSDHGSLFRIESVQYDPAEVVVTRRSAPAAPVETEVLHLKPRGPGVAETANAKSILSRPATGIATNTK